MFTNFIRIQNRLSFQSFGGKKSQENDSQMLFESQENNYQKISTVLSQSSHSTNIGEMEETLMEAMDTHNINDEDLGNCSSGFRTRGVIKQPQKRQFQSVSFDISKSPRFEKPRRHSNSEKVCETHSFFDGEDMDCSQESVSMLQGLYENPKNEFPELTETCMDTELEVISIYTDEEQEEDNDEVVKIENSTQTNFLETQIKITDPKEKEIAKHANFIKSVVKLKTLLSSKEPVSDKEVWNVLHDAIKCGKINSEEYFKDLEVEGEDDCHSVPKEALGYLLRSTNVDSAFGETVRTLLLDLENVLSEDFLKIATCWKNSVYEMAVGMLIDAADCEVEVRKMVDTFLCEKIESILKDGGKSKNFALESKANIIISFCKSTYLSYTIINFIVRKLEKLKIIQLKSESLTENFHWMNLTKNSYYLLRILESSLDILKDKITKGKVDVLNKKPEQKNYNVLEMWRKHWNKNEVLEKEDTGHEWEVVVSQWCANLDEILLHCVNCNPVLSMAVERCGMLVKEILKIRHPEILDEKMKKSTLLDN